MTNQSPRIVRTTEFDSNASPGKVFGVRQWTWCDGNVEQWGPGEGHLKEDRAMEMAKHHPVLGVFLGEQILLPAVRARIDEEIKDLPAIVAAREEEARLFGIYAEMRKVPDAVYDREIDRIREVPWRLGGEEMEEAAAVARAEILDPPRIAAYTASAALNAAIDAERGARYVQAVYA